MIRELREDDFTPLEGHPARQRFAEFTYGYISPHVQQRVRPLAARAAAELGREALNRHDQEPLPAKTAVELHTERDLSAVEAWLRELPVRLTTPVVVSWDASTAVCTDWELFVLHWDDFCRPSSDDTTVWALEGNWTLCFWHHGLLRFSSQPHAV